jgi:hypothetical protein
MCHHQLVQSNKIMSNQSVGLPRENIKAKNQDEQECENVEEPFVTFYLKSASKDMSIDEEASVHAEIRLASMFCGCLSILDWQ